MSVSTLQITTPLTDDTCTVCVCVQVRIDGYFDRIQRIIAKGKISGRIQCMLQDVLELRENKWVPRRRQNTAPKTLDQVGEEGVLSVSNKDPLK